MCAPYIFQATISTLPNKHEVKEPYIFSIPMGKQNINVSFTFFYLSANDVSLTCNRLK